MHRISIHTLSLGLVWLLLTVSASAQDPDLTILTEDPNGFLRGGALMGISGNGRFVAFWSINPLLPEDTTGSQIYVRDLETGALELISARPDGNASAEQQPEPLSSPFDANKRFISDDGRFIIWASNAPDLVPGVDPELRLWLFMRDRVTQTTRLVSVNSGDEPPTLNGAKVQVDSYTMDPTGTAVLFSTPADNMDPVFANGPWFLHRTDAPVGSSVRTRAACRDRDGVPQNCQNPALSCGGALVVAGITGSIPWIEGEDVPFGGFYSDIAIGNTIDGNWIRIGAEADNPLPPDDGILSNNGSSPAAINCTGDRIAFWTNMELRSGDTSDPDLYVFNVISRQLWLIEEPSGTSLFDGQTGRVAMSSDGLDIVFSTDRALDARDTNGFRDVYHFEMPPNPASLAFDFDWVSHNDFVPANSIFLDQLGIGGNGVAGFRTSANDPPPWPGNAGGIRGQVYAREGLPKEFIFVGGFE